MPVTKRLIVRNRAGARLLFGAIVILLGIVLLLDTTGTYAIDGLSVFLAGLFVLYGLYRFVRSRLTRVFWPGVFVLVGGLWLAVEFEVMTEGAAWDFWPLVIVLFGVSLLLGRRGRSAVVLGPISNDVWEDADGDDVVAVFGTARADLRGETGPARLEPVAIFGTVEVFVPADWTVDVETVRIFGDVKDDRRHSGRHDETDLVLEGAAIFGDVLLRE
ncbi:MAG: LiaF transmembrane domain-containing protein [Halolamina sp.]